MKQLGFCPITKSECREDCMWYVAYTQRSKKYDTCAFTEMAVQLEFLADYSEPAQSVGLAEAKQKGCGTCKHFPPNTDWPCVDCDMSVHDRWE